MTTEELKQLLRASPFRPFTAYLASEKAFTVRHPDFAVLTPKGRTLILLHTEDEAVDLLDVPLIARVEVHDPNKAPA
jgi:hypothetical protein